ncbi:hypothetical protein [Roseixanthobacter liquoris]|uniref:hypothetical protein n=1 Tax=Roseixanthobacter liquoris TaxID=3119921 RepID=UPI00372B0050
MVEQKSVETKPQRSNDSRRKERESLILLHLIAAHGGAAAQKELTDRKVKCDPAERGPLEDAGLIRTMKRGRGNFIEVTDKGWDHAGKNLRTLLPGDAEGAGAVLYAWLGRLHAFIEGQGKVLADLMVSPAPPEPTPELPPVSPEGLPKRIRDTYLAVTGGSLNVRVLLADLRPCLADVPRATLDAALIAMQREGNAILYRMDNSAALSGADRDAALSIAGEPRHMLWIPK